MRPHYRILDHVPGGIPFSLDWFDYGGLDPYFPVQPAWFVKKPFQEIIGRPMPETAADITPEESLHYKRECWRTSSNASARPYANPAPKPRSGSTYPTSTLPNRYGSTIRCLTKATFDR